MSTYWVTQTCRYPVQFACGSAAEEYARKISAEKVFVRGEEF